MVVISFSNFGHFPYSFWYGQVLNGKQKYCLGWPGWEAGGMVIEVEVVLKVMR